MEPNFKMVGVVVGLGVLGICSCNFCLIALVFFCLCFFGLYVRRSTIFFCFVFGVHYRFGDSNYWSGERFSEVIIFLQSAYYFTTGIIISQFSSMGLLYTLGTLKSYSMGLKVC